MRASTLGPAQHVSIIRSQLNVTQKYLPTTDGAGRIKDRVKASLVGGGDFQERSQYSKAQVKEYNVFIPHRPNCWCRRKPVKAQSSFYTRTKKKTMWIEINFIYFKKNEIKLNGRFVSMNVWTHERKSIMQWGEMRRWWSDNDNDDIIFDELRYTDELTN